MGALLASTQRDIALSSLNEHSVATVLEGPRIGALPTFPNPQTMLFLAFIFGLVLGGTISWVTWNLPIAVAEGRAGAQARDRYPRAET
jgi:hypothetical protein